MIPEETIRKMAQTMDECSDEELSEYLYTAAAREPFLFVWVLRKFRSEASRDALLASVMAAMVLISEGGDE